MSNRRKSVVRPMTMEQQQKEAEVSTMLRDAEKSAVVQILSEDRSSTGLMHVLNNTTGFAEAMASKFHDPRTPKVDCKEGCNWCCYQTVAVTAPEALAIARFIKSTLDESVDDTVHARLLEVKEKTHNLTPKERTKRHIPCAFLDEGRCSIYPVRPLACAEFTSMDVNDCKRGYRVGFKPKGIIHEKARMVTFFAIRQGMLEGLREALPGSDADQYELVAAVMAAMPEDAGERLIAGDKIFAGAELTVDASASTEPKYEPASE
jgi:Fe-S-cluster containining protein